MGKNVRKLQKPFPILFRPDALYETNSDKANLDYLSFKQP